MNSKLQLNLREWALLSLLVVIVTAVAYYYLLLAPLTATIAAVRTELTQAEQQLSERREWQARDAATVANIQTLTKERAALQAELDVVSFEQDIIDYLVALSTSTGSRVHSIEITAEQLKLHVAAGNYEQLRQLLNALEQDPNFVPLTSSISLDAQGSFDLQLQAKLVLGQGAPSGVLAYPRTIPFGR